MADNPHTHSATKQVFIKNSFFFQIKQSTIISDKICSLNSKGIRL